ncbi:MAG: hypothetical protein QME58_11275 [Bacteroidota bacterium]|nr:hypothetical protein [Bacteroidota bacterium]
MFGKGAIILVLGFGIIFGIVGTRLNRLESNSIDNMAYYFDITQSHNLAVMGANAAVSKLYQNPSFRGAMPTQTFTTGNLKGGSFVSRVDSLNMSTLRLRTVSTFISTRVTPPKTYRDTVEVFFSKQLTQSFSMYAWMTNFEGNVFWITGDTVWGRVHSNGNFHISGSPVFIEKVTTAKGFNPKPGSGRSNAIFKKGYETGVSPIQYPTNLNELIAASTSGGRRYTNNIWVTLSAGTAANNDGKAYIQNSVSGPIVDSITLNAAGFNGVILGNQRVYVKGQLDGRLSIGSLNEMFIVDDVTYERNPLTIPSTDDMLGLVSETNVIVSNNTANNTNCEIHASIFSRSGSFTAENWNSRPVSGWLRIIGGLIQDRRGAVGRFAGSTLVNGFSKRYYYDPRLSDPSVRPPFFPGFYRSTYSITQWWENVRIPEY